VYPTDLLAIARETAECGESLPVFADNAVCYSHSVKSHCSGNAGHKQGEFGAWNNRFNARASFVAFFFGIAYVHHFQG
jgi:hypothetical protein